MKKSIFNPKALLVSTILSVSMLMPSVAYSTEPAVLTTTATTATTQGPVVSEVSIDIWSLISALLEDYQSNELEKTSQYLSKYFNINYSSETVTRQGFENGLKNFSSVTTEGTGNLTVAEAVKASVIAANLEDLALTYSRDTYAKAHMVLNSYGVDYTNTAYIAYIACAIDSGLIQPLATYDVELSKLLAEELLMNIAEFRGEARNYIGKISDHDIYQKINAAYNGFADVSRFNAEDLLEMGNALVLNNLSTGFNVKYDNYGANFLPSHTIQYGHSNLTHAIQLISLLNSEGIDGLVQLEPKISAYEHMSGWGVPNLNNNSPTHQTLKVDDRYIVYAFEYDLLIEFDNLDGMERFDLLIDEYSKKWTANRNDDGSFTPSLLTGAWWQPLYSTTVTMPDAEAYAPIIDNVISTTDGYSIHAFTLTNSYTTFNSFLKDEFSDVDFTVKPYRRYVNAAFDRYLKGDFE